MKKILNLVLGMFALGIASMAAAPNASAQTWGNAVPYNSGATWYNGAVTAWLYTNTTNAAYGTQTGAYNAHTGGYYIVCVNYPLYGLPQGTPQTWTGTARRFDYWCPNGAYVSSSQGWVLDN